MTLTLKVGNVNRIEKSKKKQQVERKVEQNRITDSSAHFKKLMLDVGRYQKSGQFSDFFNLRAVEGTLQNLIRFY